MKIKHIIVIAIIICLFTTIGIILGAKNGINVINFDIQKIMSLNEVNQEGQHKYFIKHYYGGKIDTGETKEVFASIGDTISQVDKIEKNDYIFKEEKNVPLEITGNEEKDVIEVYYEKHEIIIEKEFIDIEDAEIKNMQDKAFNFKVYLGDENIEEFSNSNLYNGEYELITSSGKSFQNMTDGQLSLRPGEKAIIHDIEESNYKVIEEEEYYYKIKNIDVYEFDTADRQYKEYDDEDADVINLQEPSVSGTIKTISKKIVFKNGPDHRTTIKGRKIWAGTPSKGLQIPEEIEIVLLKFDSMGTLKEKYYTTAHAPNYEFEFNNAFDLDGREDDTYLVRDKRSDDIYDFYFTPRYYTYENLSGGRDSYENYCTEIGDGAYYMMTQEGSKENGYEITNTLQQERNLTVRKEWYIPAYDNLVPEDSNYPWNVNASLQANVSYSEYNYNVSISLEQSSNWETTVTVPKYDTNGNVIDYMLVEDTHLDNWESSIMDDGEDGYIIKNTYNGRYIPTYDTVNFTVTKEWEYNGGGTPTYSKPESIYITLESSGTNTQMPGTYDTTVELSESNEWTYTFFGLPKYDDMGTEIVYSAREDSWLDYYIQRDSYLVGNTYTIVNEYTGPYLPELEVTKSATTQYGKDYVLPGEEITYTITATDTSWNNYIEGDITVSDIIPEGTTFVSGSIAIDGYSGGYYYDENSLRTGIVLNMRENQKTIQFKVTVDDDATGVIRNKATVNGNETNETENPVLNIEKTATVVERQSNLSGNEVSVGDIIEYKIKITNPGKAISLGYYDELEVQDTIPNGTELVEYSINEYGYEYNNVVFWSIDYLGEREEKELSFQVKVKYLDANTIIRNVATVGQETTNETQNSYKVPETELSSTLNKTCLSSNITSTNQKIDYKVIFNGTIKNFTGKAKITLTDTLPYKIDKENSKFDNGEYNDDKIITWEQIIDVDTSNQENGEQNIKIEKNLSLLYLYEDLEENPGTIENNVHSRIELIKQEQVKDTDEKDSSADIDVNFKPRVIVHHYIEDTSEQVPSKLGDGKRVDDEIQEGTIGQEYHTQPSENVQQNYSVVDPNPAGANGNMTLKEIVVIYYYRLREPSIMSPEITKEGPNETITDKDVRVPYTINYVATIDNYIGDATVTIVDKLPYHIDSKLSSLQDGQYDQAQKTITWTEEIKNINSYEEEKNNINIRKEIELVYTDIETSATSMTNDVTGTVHLKTPGKTEESTGSETTQLDFNIDIPVTKIWDDDNDKEKNRPNEIEIILKENGTEKKTQVLNNQNKSIDNNTWEYTFTNLPKYDEAGNKIVYTIEEREKQENGLKYYTSKVTGDDVEKGITITNSSNFAKVIVHHYVLGTKEQVPAKDGGTVQDEIKKGNVGDPYSTEKSNNISPNYEYFVTDGDEKGNMAKGTIEVIYYYRLKDPKVTETDVIKEGPSKITDNDAKISYTIKYVAVIDDYIGDATVTIIDKLPYHIDEKVSKLDGGKYDEKNKTITWNSEIKGINSYEDKNDDINIQKEIELVYTDISKSATSMTNSVTGRLDLLTTKTHYENEDKVKTELGKLGEVIVKYKDKSTGKEIEDKVSKKGKVGEKFDVTPDKKKIPGYTLVEEPKEKTGEFKENLQEKTYYYAKDTTVHVTYVDKLTKEEIAKDELINGYEGKDYNTKQKEIDKYKFVESTNNTKGKMARKQIEVIYYYVRPAKVVVRYVEKGTGKDLIEQEEKKGYQDDKYTTEEKHLKFYNLLEKPNNAKGNMTVTIKRDKDGKVTVNDTTYVIYYYEKKPFNLKLEKKIDSIILNGKKIRVNGDLGKAEIYRKVVNTSQLEVVYTIKVVNTGDITGKAIIRENIPNGMVMNRESNSEWTVKENDAILETDNINPGEAKEYKVRLTWRANSADIGQKTNTAEIISTKNDVGFEETIKVDNVDTADLIIAIGTGNEVINEVLIGNGVMAIMLIGLIVLAKWERKKEEK